MSAAPTDRERVMSVYREGIAALRSVGALRQIDALPSASLLRETVEEPVASGRLQVRLAAAFRHVCGVPGRRAGAAALAIVVADLRAPRCVAGPVATGGGSRVSRKGRAIGLR
jgi:hypothetical protein